MANVGVCEQGAQACVESQNGEQTINTWGPCAGQGHPSAEVCGNQLDDNCDGTVDDGCSGCTDGVTQPCSSACGSGTETCVGGQWVQLQRAAPQRRRLMHPQLQPGRQPAHRLGSLPVQLLRRRHPVQRRALRALHGRIRAVGRRRPLHPDALQDLPLPTKDGTYYQMGDYAGHGQDHCEMVNDAFTIPNEDDVTSGCPTCDLGNIIFSDPANGPVYSRAFFGDCFQYEAQWPQFNLYSVTWYECGVSIP